VSIAVCRSGHAATATGSPIVEPAIGGHLWHPVTDELKVCVLRSRSSNGTETTPHHADAWQLMSG
jgi:hypothetical protein